MKKMYRWFVLLCAASLLAVGATPAGAAGTPDSGIHVNPIPAIEKRPDFIRGADVSMLKQIEASGGAFYDGGVKKDALQIFKDHGVNWVRLRLWNQPSDANGPFGGGNNDKERTIGLASRAKALGLKVLLDIHYSDWWADPGNQTKPAAWKDLTGQALEQAVYDYTDDVLKGLAASAAFPDMVQIGNETNGGMLWPDGKTWKGPKDPQVGGFDGWAGLLKAGVKAVRDNDSSHRTKIMIHLANGGDNGLYRWAFDELTKRNVDFDVIGLSYYPYWHGTLEQLQNNMNDISARYGKEVAVAETAYAFTLENGDGHGNIFGPGQEDAGGYKATLQGQAQAMRDVANAVAQVPNNKGLGLFYWEPDWIPAEGAGWKTGEGNAWDNQAVFDFQGRSLPTIDLFDFQSEIYNKEPVTATAKLVRPVTASTTVGEAPALPAAVKIEYSDDSIRQSAVTWNPVPAASYSHPGTFTVKGSAAGSSAPAIATVTVRGATNFANNGSFEKGSFDGWTAQGDNAAVSVEKSAAPGGNSHGGDYSLHYWLDKPFQFTVSQTITGLKPGSYSLSAWAHGGGGENGLQLFVACDGATAQTADIVNTAWHEWKNPEIRNVKVTGGSCTIGVKADAKSGNWGNVDDIQFITDATAETLKAPASVKDGSKFAVEAGIAGLTDIIKAQEITIAYDQNLFRFESAEALGKGVKIVKKVAGTPGVLTLRIENQAGWNQASPSVRLIFKAKAGSAKQATGTIQVKEAIWEYETDGGKAMPTTLGKSSVTISKGNGGKQR